MQLFQYAILWHPTEQQAKDGKKDTLAVDVTTVLAKDQRMAIMLAGRDIPDEYLEQIDQLEIAVRPF